MKIYNNDLQPLLSLIEVCLCARNFVRNKLHDQQQHPRKKINMANGFYPMGQVLLLHPTRGTADWIRSTRLKT